MLGLGMIEDSHRAKLQQPYFSCSRGWQRTTNHWFWEYVNYQYIPYLNNSKSQIGILLDSWIDTIAIPFSRDFLGIYLFITLPSDN